MADRCDAVAVSYVHSTQEIRLREIIHDEDGKCLNVGMPGVLISLDGAFALWKGLNRMLEHVGYLPTDEQFEAFRLKLLEDLHG